MEEPISAEYFLFGGLVPRRERCGGKATAIFTLLIGLGCLGLWRQVHQSLADAKVVNRAWQRTVRQVEDRDFEHIEPPTQTAGYNRRPWQARMPRRLQWVASNRHVLQNGAELLRKAIPHLDQDDGDRLEEKLERLSEPLRIAVVGCFNSGKSTLINAIVGAPQCRTGLTPTTMKIQTIWDDAGRFQLVDTMGVNAPDFKHHKKETVQAMQNCDAVLLVLRAHEPVNNDEEELIKLINKNAQPVIVVATWWDIVSQKLGREACCSRISNFVRNEIESPEEIPIYFLDANSAEEAVLTHNVWYYDEELIKLKETLESMRTSKAVKYKLVPLLGWAIKALSNEVTRVAQRKTILQQKQNKLAQNFEKWEKPIQKKVDDTDDIIRSSRARQEQAIKHLHHDIEEATASLREAEKKCEDKTSKWVAFKRGAVTAFKRGFVGVHGIASGALECAEQSAKNSELEMTLQQRKKRYEDLKRRLESYKADALKELERLQVANNKEKGELLEGQRKHRNEMDEIAGTLRALDMRVSGTKELIEQIEIKHSTIQQYLR